MTKYQSYNSGAAPSGYAWSGLNTENMFASLVYIPEDIYATAISVYWGGKGGAAAGYHCIWDSSGTGPLIVNSGTVSAPASSVSSGGQQWLTASISETLLTGGKNYFVGVWCNPSEPRVWSVWSNGSVNKDNYIKTDTSWPANYSGSTAKTDGVIAAYITGEPAGKMWVNAGGTQEHGNTYVNVSGSWKKSKGVWVNTSGTWQRGK